MRTRKAVRLAEKILRLAEDRDWWLSAGGDNRTYSPAALRAERDLLIEVATELRRLAAKQGAKK